MSITGLFVLPEGVAFEPIDRLPEAIQRQISAQPGDYALSRTNARSYSKVVDAESVELIRQFERPSTIAQAVARFSLNKRLDAEQVLVESLPLMRSLLESGLLVVAGSPDVAAIAIALEAGIVIDGWTVVRAIQSLEDAEVYQVRARDGSFAAMKIGRTGVESARNANEREATILTRLEGTVAPRLLGAGSWNARPYVVLEWLAGSEAQHACSEFRVFRDSSTLESLHAICGSIIDAFVQLHDRGVIHGDVHPRNVLVDRNLNVKLVDFGLARLADATEDSRPQRGGVSFYFEPEFAKAAEEGSPPPATSFAGEQYAVGAMLYQLLTGLHYLDFSFGKETMLHQIANDEMVPFERRSGDAWPDAERVLARALQKAPEDRFYSLNDFARAWKDVAIPSKLVRADVSSNAKLSGVRAEVIAAAAIGGSLLRNGMGPPTTSVVYGSSGFAYALYRLACARDDGELLALADAWCERSRRAINDDDAFLNADLQVTADIIGPHSLYHGPLGVCATTALIASARGDTLLHDGATARFLEILRQPASYVDLIGGTAGALLGCALLFDVSQTRRVELRDAGATLVGQLQEVMEQSGPSFESSQLGYFGIAHGWAGLLYAALTWAAATQGKISNSLVARLDELGDGAQPSGRGLQWKISARAPSSDRGFATSWCNGSAGYVFLWTQAYNATRDARYLELAEGAAWHAWETGTPNPSLCCGMAGQAYAMLNFYRHCGNDLWLLRARRIAQYASEAVKSTESGEGGSSDWRLGSLYKSAAALALLNDDLTRPEDARMPMFEREI